MLQAAGMSTSKREMVLVVQKEVVVVAVVQVDL